ncbi:hypothetical protein, partial [Pseudomonas sp. GW456-12-10-14-LB2]|uniref:hypothetical protein n=1 Tax=Pseudomonas sp. GW456-12-10-14-LB2 TaxID=2070674 RepID=UPI001C496DBC
CFCLCVQGFDRVLGLGLAAFGPAMLRFYRVHIRFFGCARWRFRPYGEALFSNAKKVPKKARPGVRPSQARVPSLRRPSGGIDFVDEFGFAKRRCAPIPG